MLLKKAAFIWIFLVLMLNSASAQYYYDQNLAYGLGGLDDILYVYEIYSSWFDFFIFLLIFLGLTQAVFGNSHLKEQSKTLSIGISLALSFALSAWERYNGVNILSFGPIAFLIFVLLLFFVVFKLLQKMEASWLTSVAWGYVIAFAALMIFGQTVVLNWLVNYAGGIFQLLYLLFWVAIILGVIGLFSGKATH